MRYPYSRTSFNRGCWQSFPSQPRLCQCCNQPTLLRWPWDHLDLDQKLCNLHLWWWSGHALYPFLYKVHGFERLDVHFPNWWSGSGAYKSSWYDVYIALKREEPDSTFVVTPSVGRSSLTIDLTIGLINMIGIGTFWNIVSIGQPWLVLQSYPLGSCIPLLCGRDYDGIGSACVHRHWLG